MKKIVLFLLPVFLLFSFRKTNEPEAWIRVNQLGYTPGGVKVAVWCSKGAAPVDRFQLVDAASNQTIYEGKASKALGAYGPFSQTARLSFTGFQKPGRYKL